MPDIRYQPGKWFGVISGHGMALLPDVLSEEDVKRVWQSFEAGQGLGGVLETLTAAFGVGLTSLPPFAVASIDGDNVRVAVRGDLIVEVMPETHGAVESISGEGVLTWTEQSVPNPAMVSIRVKRAGRVSNLSLPISNGVVLASRLTTTYRGETVEADPVEAAPAEVVPEEVAPVEAEPSEAAPAAQPLDEWGHENAADFGHASAEVEPEAPFSNPEPEPEPEPAEATPQVEQATPLDETRAPELTQAEAWAHPAPEADDDYDHLFGETVARSVEGAAVRSTEPSTDELGQSALISIPSFSNAGLRPPPPPPPTAQGDHDGHTISVAEARALLAGAAGTAGPSGAPESSPSAPVNPAAAISHGRIELSTGDTITLDRPVIIGRKPRATRVSPDGVPHLVTVPSPQQDISRSHVEIQIEGSHVIARDLDTTNGTMLRRPGQAPLRLTVSDSVLALSGDVLDLGDGITVTFRDIP